MSPMMSLSNRSRLRHRLRRVIAAALSALMVAVILSSSSAIAAAAPKIKIVINGTVIPSDTAPSVQSGRVLVPLRVISEYLGATVAYEAKTKTVTAALNGTTISLRLGEKKATVNKAVVSLEVAATAVSGHTIVPLRFIGQAFGASVNWDAKSNSVIIRRDGTVSDLHYDKGTGQATVTIDVKGGASGFTTAVTSNPDRLIVDISGAELGLPKTTYEFNDPALTGARAGQISQNPDVTRVILEFPEATVTKVAADAAKTAIKVTFGYKVTKIGLETRGQEKVVAIGTTGPVKCETAVLTGPDRAIIDVQGATLSAALTQTALQFSDDTISQLRVAQFASNPDVVRVVADLKKPAGMGIETRDLEAVGHFLTTVNRLSYEKTAAGARLTVDASQGVSWNVSRLAYPNRLVIELPFAAAGVIGAGQAPNDGLVRTISWSQSSASPPSVDLTIESPSMLDYQVTPGADGKQLVFTLTPASIAGKLVVVDPGHGGPDPGARGPKGTLEKDIDLAISLYLRDSLEAAGARVMILRTADVDVGLYDRPAMANAAGADLFVSVHNNANPYALLSGTETYYTDTNPLNRYLADKVHAAVVTSLGTIDRGVRTEPFVVIRETKAPSVLVEGLYLSNPTDEKRLKDPNFQRSLAQAIAKGLTAFYQAVN
ncbi:MAG TPA: N-acetylmuramoyl-L-alanine amidase [Bacillota bacterium]|jgi:N-acetylmuramoyl-L-alanine amidase